MLYSSHDKISALFCLYMSNNVARDSRKCVGGNMPDRKITLLARILLKLNPPRGIVLTYLAGPLGKKLIGLL